MYIHLFLLLFSNRYTFLVGLVLVPGKTPFDFKNNSKDLNNWF